MGKISILAELDRMGWDYQSASGAEVKVKCPFHEDSVPSASINLENELFKCFSASCGASGDFMTFVARATNVDRRTVFVALAKRYNLEDVKSVNIEVVERAHQEL